MDIKTMLVAAAEEQADKVIDNMMDAINSDEMENQIASAINAKINIPFVSEADEQKLFKQVVDVITDLIAGLFKSR